MWPARSDAAEKGGRPLLGLDRDDVGVVAGRMEGNDGWREERPLDEERRAGKTFWFKAVWTEIKLFEPVT